MILFQIYFVCLFVLYSKFESTKMHVLYLKKKIQVKTHCFYSLQRTHHIFKNWYRKSSIDVIFCRLFLFISTFYAILICILRAWLIAVIQYCIFSNCNSCVYQLIYEISNNFNHCLRKNKQLSQECSTLFITWTFTFY